MSKKAGKRQMMRSTLQRIKAIRAENISGKEAETELQRYIDRQYP